MGAASLTIDFELPLSPKLRSVAADSFGTVAMLTWVPVSVKPGPWLHRWKPARRSAHCGDAPRYRQRSTLRHARGPPSVRTNVSRRRCPRGSATPSLAKWLMRSGRVVMAVSSGQRYGKRVAPPAQLSGTATVRPEASPSSMTAIPSGPLTRAPVLGPLERHNALGALRKNLKRRGSTPPGHSSR